VVYVSFSYDVQLLSTACRKSCMIDSPALVGQRQIAKMAVPETEPASSEELTETELASSEKLTKLAAVKAAA